MENKDGYIHILRALNWVKTIHVNLEKKKNIQVSKVNILTIMMYCELSIDYSEKHAKQLV